MGARVLVVEDESIVAMGIKHKLQNLGHSVVDMVATGEDAIKSARENHPEIILMDIVLKGEIDGIEATQIIRKKQDIPVIYLTAYADEEMLSRAKVTEPYGYIIKPFKSSEINANIEMAIYKHASSKKQNEILKKRILADFYDFILRAMPGSTTPDETEMRKLLANVFADRMELDMRPGFDKALSDNSIDYDSAEEIFEAYVDWITSVFSDLGIRIGLKSETTSFFIEFDNCPWIDESCKNPIFCLNCQSMINRSFKWTNLEGEINRRSTIASGSPSCIFSFNL
ncbi:methanogen output domain 1-containing protein [Methanobacterium alkalithermotolerans]|uniref:Methanogen output domain 1-containing protein n=1 Tax=Methanobacterium alkalithermotolerans TaxID=2731220 RepID=A0A8T8K5Q6_9EURY|nr:methanogen output domain 1-containing protein [Methanobacterium alkalithermotolerans]QUH22463.1 methanogen output domain 1-containing protein [Methanobacterium alkalithermotolerans]RJS48188.1 MAG: response regulator [Methanobacterium sp.]